MAASANPNCRTIRTKLCADRTDQRPFPQHRFPRARPGAAAVDGTHLCADPDVFFSSILAIGSIRHSNLRCMVDKVAACCHL